MSKDTAYVFSGREEVRKAFDGGRINVYGDSRSGWTVDHQPRSGGTYPCHWSETKYEALRYAEQRARHFASTLFVEQPLD